MNLEALQAAVWCYLGDEAVAVLLRLHEWYFPRQAGSCQKARYVANIGPFCISGGVLTPLAWSHEVTILKPRIPRVSNDDQLLALEFAPLVDDSQSLLTNAIPLSCSNIRLRFAAGTGSQPWVCCSPLLQLLVPDKSSAERSGLGRCSWPVWDCWPWTKCSGQVQSIWLAPSACG